MTESCNLLISPRSSNGSERTASFEDACLRTSFQGSGPFKGSLGTVQAGPAEELVRRSPG